MSKKNREPRIKTKVLEVKSKSLFGKTQMEKTIERMTSQGWEINRQRKLENKNRYRIEFIYKMSEEEMAKEDRANTIRGAILGTLILACCGFSYIQNQAVQRQEAVTQTQSSIERATFIAQESTQYAHATQTATLWTSTPTLTPSMTSTLTLTPTITPTPTITNTPTLTYTPSVTPSSTITNTPRPTNTDSPTRTPRPTDIPRPTSIPSGSTYYSEGNAVNARECPRLSCDIAAVLTFAQEIEIIDTSVNGDAVGGDTRWMQGVINGQVVYVHSSLVSRTRPQPVQVVPVAPQNNTSSSTGTTNVQSVPPAQPAGSNCTCAADTYNCTNGSFSSRAEAQACYDKCWAERGYDVHGLDGNNDGNICESGVR